MTYDATGIIDVAFAGKVLTVKLTNASEWTVGKKVTLAAGAVTTANGTNTNGIITFAENTDGYTFAHS